MDRGPRHRVMDVLNLNAMLGIIVYLYTKNDSETEMICQLRKTTLNFFIIIVSQTYRTSCIQLSTLGYIYNIF